MGRHRHVSGNRRVAAPPRPRYARISAAGSALAVTLVAVLAGMGVIPGSPANRSVASAQMVAETDRDATGAERSSSRGTSTEADRGSVARTTSGTSRGDQATGKTPRATLPANSGDGRRIVFAMGAQRVWLVDEKAGRDQVVRTYLVSGSVTDNLSAGTFSVYSKSEHAIGVDDSGTMQYMVRFTHGQNAAIGFHDIPVSHGHLVQTRDLLGTPQSHGCIRQWRPDAKALWAFAPVGTKVVVVA